MAAVTPTRAPRVSVIIPARNEEASLGACLASLVNQPDVAFEIIVVNDHSSDRTREIAEQFGVVVIDAPSLQMPFTGKNNALIAGAAKANGDWLLFTDADTIHKPGSLERSLREAEQRRVDMLSYSPQQEVDGVLEKAVMPVIFAELATTYRPASVSDPSSPAAAANGQYLLIRKEVYEAVGGHKAIADSILEDVALARAVKRSGKKIFFRYAADAVSTRMYRSFAELREGWTKNLVLLFPAPVQLAALRITEFCFLALSGTLAVVTYREGRPRLSALLAAAFAIAYSFLLKRILKAHFSWNSNILAVVGLPVFSYLLLRSKLAHATGNVVWKGRTYGAGEGNGSSLAAPAKADFIQQ